MHIDNTASALWGPKLLGQKYFLDKIVDPLASYALLLRPLDLGNLRNLFNRIRIVMGKFGCTQIRTSSYCSPEKKKDLFNFWRGLE